MGFFQIAYTVFRGEAIATKHEDVSAARKAVRNRTGRTKGTTWSKHNIHANVDVTFKVVNDEVVAYIFSAAPFNRSTVERFLALPQGTFTNLELSKEK